MRVISFTGILAVAGLAGLSFVPAVADDTHGPEFVVAAAPELPKPLETRTIAMPDLDAMLSSEVELGYQGGGLRLDVDFGTESGGVADRDGEYQLGTSTLNMSWDIYRFGPEKSATLDEPTVTPWVGFGLGAAAGVVDKLADARGQDGQGAHRLVGGPGGRVGAGLKVGMTDAIDLTVGYGYQAYFLGRGNGTFESHSGQLGMKVSF